MFIQTEATPNPATLKFLPGRAVLETGTLDMAEQGSRRAIAAGRGAVRNSQRRRRLLRLRLHLHHQDATAIGSRSSRRSSAPSWSISSAARRCWRTGPTPAPADADEFFDAKDADTVATIKDLIETRVRPAVAGDGGDITFKGFKEGVVFLR